MLGQTRVLFAMSRDGLLPRQLAVTGSHGTPVRITVIVGVLVAIAASVFPMGRLEEMVNIGTLFAFVLVSAGVIVLRRTRPDLARGFRVPWVPVLPIAAILACLWLMLNLTGLTWIRFLHLDGDRRGGLLRSMAGGTRCWPTGTPPRCRPPCRGGATTRLDNLRDTRQSTPRSSQLLYKT